MDVFLMLGKVKEGHPACPEALIQDKIPGADAS
jgi:hypothetical protein